MTRFPYPTVWLGVLGPLSLAAPTPAHAFAIEAVHFAEPPVGHHTYVVSYTVLTEPGEDGMTLDVALADQDGVHAEVIAPLERYSIRGRSVAGPLGAEDSPLSVVDSRKFKAVCKGGGIFINGHSTGEKQAELSLCVQLEDPTGTPVGEPKYSGDVTISCMALDPAATRQGAEGESESSEVRTHLHAPRRYHEIGDPFRFTIVVWDGTRTCGSHRKPRGKLHAEVWMVRPDGSKEVIGRGRVGDISEPTILRGAIDTIGFAIGHYKFWVRIIDGGGHTISEGHHHAPMGARI